MMDARRAWWALVRFHAGAGVRAARRSAVISVAVVIFALGSTPSPVATLESLVRALVSNAADTGIPGRLAFVAFTASLSALAARRTATGIHGWFRSLPVAGPTARRAVWGAGVLGALPAILIGAAAVVLAVSVHDVPLEGALLAALAVMVTAAAAAVVPPEHGSSRLAAIAACLASAWGTWTSVLVALLALGVWDRVAGGLGAPAAARRSSMSDMGAALAARAPGPAGSRRHGLLLAARLVRRVIGARTWAQAVAVGGLPVTFAALVEYNNSWHDPATQRATALLGTGIGLVSFSGIVTSAMLARRPPWPWIRSLPWSAGERVAVDVIVLGSPTIAFAIAAACVLAWRTGTIAGAAVTGAATLALSAACTAEGVGALRVGAGRHTGAAGEIVIVGAAATAAVASNPWLTAGVLALVPALVLLAIRRERRAAGAVRWDELRHGVEGDVGWLSRV